MLKSALTLTADHPCVWYSKKSKYTSYILKLNSWAAGVKLWVSERCMGLDCVHELKNLTELSKGKLGSLKKSLVEHNYCFHAFWKPYQHVSVFWEHDPVL